MEDALTSVLEAISRFEYLIAKKEHSKLQHLIKNDKQNGERFRRNQLKSHENAIKAMLHKCDEIDLAFEGQCSMSYQTCVFADSRLFVLQPVPRITRTG